MAIIYLFYKNIKHMKHTLYNKNKNARKFILSILIIKRCFRSLPKASKQLYEALEREKEWFNLITEYVKVSPARLTKEILNEYDIYLGMRNRSEFNESKSEFDLIIWISSDKRKGIPKYDGSNELTQSDADIIIDNNSTLEEFYSRIDKFITPYLYKTS